MKICKKRQPEPQDIKTEQDIKIEPKDIKIGQGDPDIGDIGEGEAIDDPRDFADRLVDVMEAALKQK